MQVVPLTRQESSKIHRNYKRTAEVGRLQYVNDRTPGVVRQKRGKGFTYNFKGSRIRDKDTLDRIKKLAIPPAWTKVWICAKDNGHIQAIGYDTKGRKQYKYHPQWNSIRNQTKFHHLYEFGKELPRFRKKIEIDICNSKLTKEKVLATVISLMERTFIRIGNTEYERLYGSYGLSTLKDNHVNIKGATLRFSFKGKKGIFHSITLRNKRLARIVKACREIPGKELFQYFDEDGTRCAIDSGMVNSYIKESTGKDFTAKDFRTWAGTLSVLRSFRLFGQPVDQAEIKKNVLSALDEVSTKLGNSRSVCRKYYVHPQIIALYEENNLQKYIDQLDAIEECDDISDLTREEKILMWILRKL